MCTCENAHGLCVLSPDAAQFSATVTVRDCNRDCDRGPDRAALLTYSTRTYAAVIAAYVNRANRIAVFSRTTAIPMYSKVLLTTKILPYCTYCTLPSSAVTVLYPTCTAFYAVQKPRSRPVPSRLVCPVSAPLSLSCFVPAISI